MTTKLSPPPGICEQCFTNQTHHRLDTEQGIYYCAHNKCLALPKSDLTGWICETGIDRAEWQRKAEAAATTLEVLTAQAKKMN